MLDVIYAACPYAECCYAESHGAIINSGWRSSLRKSWETIILVKTLETPSKADVLQNRFCMESDFNDWNLKLTYKRHV